MLGANTYRISIIVDGQDKGASSMLGGVHSALGNILQIALGINASQIFSKIGDMILSTGKAALSATADYQSMQIGLEGLLARELSRGEKVTELVAKNVTMTAKERLEQIELSKSFDQSANALNNLKAQYEDSVRSSGEFSETSLKLKIQLDDANQQFQSMSSRLDMLNSTAGGTVNVLQEVYKGGMSIAEAYPLAQEKAKDLMDTLSKVAILSPYNLSLVQETFRTAMAFGFASDEAATFTEATLNVAAGVGADNSMLQRMGYNLAQIRLQGKVTAMDVRQLALAGFDLNSVLQYMGDQMGVTINDHLDFNKALQQGKITWKDFTELYAKYAKENFGGASERMARSLNGLKNTFSDVWLLTVPRILGPAAEHLTDFLNNILDGFMSVRDSGILEDIGQKVGDFAKGFFDGIQGIIDGFNNFKSMVDFASWVAQNESPMQGLSTLLKNFLPPEVADLVTFYIGRIWNGFDNLKKFWDENGPTLLGQLNQFWNTIVTTFNDIASVVIPWLVEQFGKITQWVYDNGPLITEFTQSIIDGFGWVMSKVEEAWVFIEPFLTLIIDTILGLAKTIMQVATGDWAGAWDTMKSTVDTMVGKIREVIQGLANFIAGIYADIIKKLDEIITKGLESLGISAKATGAKDDLGVAGNPYGSDPKDRGYPGVPGKGKGTKKAGGGWVQAGWTYPVGENGMELFTPNMNGMIIPNSKIGDLFDQTGDGNMVNQNIYSIQIDAKVDNSIDVERLAYRVLDVIRNG